MFRDIISAATHSISILVEDSDYVEGYTMYSRISEDSQCPSIFGIHMFHCCDTVSDRTNHWAKSLFNELATKELVITAKHSEIFCFL